MFDKNYQYIDPLLLPNCKQTELLNSAIPLGVWIEPPGVEQRLSRQAPEFVDDPGSTEMFKGLGGAPYVFPPNFIVTVSDATLLGYRMVLADEVFFSDVSYGANSNLYANKLASADLFPNEDTRLRRTEQTDFFTVDIASRPTRRIEGNAVALTSTEPSNYGSFLFRVLPKIVSLEKNNLLELPVIVYANHQSYLDLLSIAGVKTENIIRHDTNVITKIDRLIVPSLRNPDAYLDPESFRFFASIIAKFGKPKVPGKKLYISRLSHGKMGGSTRVMLNEEKLIQELKSLDIEIFEPDKHSAQEQIEAFSSAEMIIGPSGAGMFNAVFCRPGTKIIDIESEPHWIYAHTGLFSSKSLRYGIFIGETMPSDTRPVHRNWTVNIEVLLERIVSFSRN